MLSGRYVRLRAIEEADIPMMARWRSAPEVYDFFYEYEPLSAVQQKEWFEAQRRNRTEKNFIISLHDGKAIGTISVYHIDARNRKAEWGRFLIGESRYIGMGAEVEYLTLQYAFEHLNLNRLYCEVLCSNPAVIGQHEKFGFKTEGTLRNQVFKRGRYEDAVMMSLLADEYRAVCQSGVYKLIGDQIARAQAAASASADK